MKKIVAIVIMLIALTSIVAVAEENNIVNFGNRIEWYCCVQDEGETIYAEVNDEMEHRIDLFASVNSYGEIQMTVYSGDEIVYEKTITNFDYWEYEVQTVFYGIYYRML